MSYRYYSTQRPVGPGTYPEPDGNKALIIKNYDGRIEIKDIGRPAWGYIEYGKRLDPDDIKNYELTPDPSVPALRITPMTRETLERFEREYETDQYNAGEMDKISFFALATVTKRDSRGEYPAGDKAYEQFLRTLVADGITLISKEAVFENDGEAEL